MIDMVGIQMFDFGFFLRLLIVAEAKLFRN